MLLVVYALGMAIGQVLFKFAADRAKVNAAEGFLTPLLSDWYFLAAVAVYGLLTILWVWVLTRIPLSRAYPFVVLAFVFTPVLASVLFGESLTGWYFLGLGLVLLGLAVLLLKAT